jgi:hypothetical protein
MKIATPLLFLLLCAPGLAQQDPLKSEACATALASLQAARTGGGNVEAVRSAAASTCLGSAAVPGRPARIAQTPVVVPPPQIDIAPRAATLPPINLPPPPVAIERAPGPALCDANGCWTSGGSQLRHVPPNLVGPAGMCSQQGGAVYCP